MSNFLNDWQNIEVAIREDKHDQRYKAREQAKRIQQEIFRLEKEIGDRKEYLKGLNKRFTLELSKANKGLIQSDANYTFRSKLKQGVWL